jgi:hypothetical protein
MKPSIALLASACLGLTGCASLMSPPDEPPADELAKATVVEYGQPAPSQPFVLHYRAGVPLAIVASVSGTLLEKEDKANLQVALRRDIYLYKYWASFDGRTWQLGDKLVASLFRIDLPGSKDGTAPGAMLAEFNQR